MKTTEAVQSTDVNTWGHWTMPHLLDTSKDNFEDVADIHFGNSRQYNMGKYLQILSWWFRMHIRKRKICRSLVQPRNRLLKEVVKFPSWEVLMPWLAKSGPTWSSVDGSCGGFTQFGCQTPTQSLSHSSFWTGQLEKKKRTSSWCVIKAF